MRIGFALALVLAASGALAHAPGHTYLFLSIGDDAVLGRVEMPLEDLRRAYGGDASIFMDAARARPNLEQVQAYVSRHLDFRVAGRPLAVAWTGRELLELEGTRFAIVEFNLALPRPPPEELEITTDLLTEALPDHRVGLVIENNSFAGIADNHLQLSFFFSPARPAFTYHIMGRSLFAQLRDFAYEGVLHIGIGLDHVLFLVALLLVAVTNRRVDGSPLETPITLSQGLINVVKIVTVFTVAHSITLALALKGWVALPSRWVESVIALSVLSVAVDNIRVIFGRWKWIIVFVFGLFHGLGFASVLLDLGLDFESKMAALIGFNIGVELGQLAIVAALFPLLFALRGPHYQKFVLVPGSAIIAVVALWWFSTRFSILRRDGRASDNGRKHIAGGSA